MPVSPVIPALRYRDARAAIAFLTDGLGFQLTACYPPEGAKVDHAELTFGDGMVMLGSVPEGDDGRMDLPVGGSSVYLVVGEDAAVDKLHDRATAAGATSARAPQDEDYGGRGCSVRDAEGNFWSIGSYAPTG